MPIFKVNFDFKSPQKIFFARYSDVQGIQNVALTQVYPSVKESDSYDTQIKKYSRKTKFWDQKKSSPPTTVRSHALRALTNVIYDRRSLKVLTIYDPRYTENASTVYDLRSLPLLTFRDLRSMTFNFTIDDHSAFVRFMIYGSRSMIHVLPSTIDDLCTFKEQAKYSSV